MKETNATQHLSSAQMNEVLLSGAAREFRSHLETCGECRAKVAAMSELLGCFGEAVVARGAALQQQLQQHRHEDHERSAAVLLRGPSRLSAPFTRPYTARLLKPVFAAAMLLLIAAVWSLAGPGRHALQGTTKVTAPSRSGTAAARTGAAGAPAISDDSLMEQISEQLAQPVPASMLPLTAMVTNQESHATVSSQREN